MSVSYPTALSKIEQRIKDTERSVVAYADSVSDYQTKLKETKETEDIRHRYGSLAAYRTNVLYDLNVTLQSHDGLSSTLKGLQRMKSIYEEL